MPFVNKLIYTIILLFILGCNSSSTSKSVNEPPNSEQEKEPDVVEQLVETPVIVSCSSLTKLEFIKAESTNELTEYIASNVIDGSFITSSRWSTLENNQTLALTLNAASLVKGLSITWFNEDQRSYHYDIAVSQDNVNWLPVITSISSNSLTTRSEYIEIDNHSARYIKVLPKGNSVNSDNHIIEVEAFGCESDVESAIALNDWYLSIPIDETQGTKAKSIYEQELNNDYFNAEFYFLNSEGGLVFRSPIEGNKTSSNTKYTRTELREMLRRGDTDIKTQGINKNNWVFSNAAEAEQNAAGGVDGELIAELAVNQVTTTGDKSQVGRVIIGQIHANDDEPIRVYYRKLPENDKGSIYFAHEIKGDDDIYYELIGTRSQSAANPENGIKLNERFSYRISVEGHLLSLSIIREGFEDINKSIDMTDSGYDSGGQYMYFKAGVYNQNNTGDDKDYVQATFYKIENSHTGYN